MKKRVYRYFFDFLDGQTEWLNQRSVQGWRLVKCGQLSYEFESCAPGEYEYAVEFVADRSFSDSRNYKDFLESMGYRVFYKNINVGVAVGKVKWRPWGTGAGQIVTAPGGYFKEILIVEKKKDGRPFELHTDLSDKLTLYKKIRNACLWSVGSMLALVVMCLSFAFVNFQNGMLAGGIVCAAAAIPAGLCVLLWSKPLRGIIEKTRAIEEDAKINECEPMKKSKKALYIMLYVLLLAAIVCVIFLFSSGSFITFNSGSALMLISTSGRTHWNANYSKLSGFRQRSVSLDDGTYTFSVEIVTNSGELNFSIKGKEGTVYYSASEIPTSTFNVEIELGHKDRVVLRVDAKNHSGSYKISWEE